MPFEVGFIIRSMVRTEKVHYPLSSKIKSFSRDQAIKLFHKLTTTKILFNFYSGVRITESQNHNITELKHNKTEKMIKEPLSFCSALCTKKINISLNNTPCDVMCSDLHCH